MTRDEILAMEPGRKLDALVAEKVMGWTEIDTSKQHWRSEMGVPDTNLMLAPIKHYSTDISAAWEIVEKMKDKELVAVFTDANNRYSCEIGSGMIEDCETAAEAICKAALLNHLEV